jgi:hypothetical protein
MRAPAQATPQLRQFVERRLCSAAAIEQRIDLLHELTERA